MKIKCRIGWLLVACLSLPFLSKAQSRESNNVVSVRELSIPPKARHAYEQGAELLLKQNAAESLPYFERAIVAFTGYYEAYYEIGVANLKLSRIPQAEQAFRASIELSDGKYPQSLVSLGAVLGYQEKFAEAEEVTRKGLDLDPTSWSGHYFLGWALLGLNRVEEAEKSVGEALRLKTDSTQALQLLADIHSREKNYRALLNDLDQYLKLDSASAIAARVRVLRDAAQRILDETQNSTALAQ